MAAMVDSLQDSLQDGLYGDAKISLSRPCRRGFWGWSFLLLYFLKARSFCIEMPAREMPTRAQRQIGTTGLITTNYLGFRKTLLRDVHARATTNY